MATDADFVEYVRDQSLLGPALRDRRMFGEYALYLDGKVVAFACNNSLFVKLTEPTAALVADLPRAPAYPGGKPMAVADEVLDDPQRLQRLLRATAAALPLPAPRVPKAAGKAAGKVAGKVAGKAVGKAVGKAAGETAEKPAGKIAQKSGAGRAAKQPAKRRRR